MSERLESYDEGLRRYPVVFYFHTRRLARSIPRVFDSLGGLMEALRWGLPAGSAMSDGPWVHVLLEQYDSTLDRLQRSFVGPRSLEPPPAVTPAEFAEAYRSGAGDASAVGFRDLQDRTRAAAGLAAPPRCRHGSHLPALLPVAGVRPAPGDGTEARRSASGL
ncbi:MAG TPA: hypothetical protein VFH70_03215 [Acidimicrobiales bacterium]|nr:hypothetical protein [Acidimicrobiales bacterium]